MCAAKRLSQLERKHEIKNAAKKVIVKRGLENATMEEIIAETTLSKGGMYHHYKSVIDIFKDIMIDGINYRDAIIKEHLETCNSNIDTALIARQIMNKIVDENPFTPLYVECLQLQKRHPELKKLLTELQEESKCHYRNILNKAYHFLLEDTTFELLTHLVNGMILASHTLEAKESFTQNRQLIEDMFVLLLKHIKTTNQ